MKPQQDESYAAIDLGSNSFHMIVANYSDGRLQIIDRIKEMVRLASGLDENNELSEDSIQRALACLQRLGERIKEIPQANIRAVGTNTVRQACNGGYFLSLADSALGHPIEIIAGQEEARLIYQGVAHTTYDEVNKRLVIDIGGGSTELIIGRGFEVFSLGSLYMGCVNMSKRFFDDGKIKTKKINKTTLYVRQELESIEAAYKKTGWDLVLGSSGTITTIRDVVQAQKWCETGITADALSKLIDALVDFGNSNAIELEGLSEHRKPVFASGVAVLAGIFEGLGLDQIGVSDGALREGLLYDLIGRMHNEDIRDKTIMDVSQRYGVDKDQANRVKETAEKLFHQVSVDWALHKKEALKLLQWGALIHEIGLSIAHAQYQQHGSYLITYSDLAGFSRQEQIKLAKLVRSHRRKFPRDEFEAISSQAQQSVIRLSILLRLAAVLHRSRSNNPLPDIRIDVNEDTINLYFPPQWLFGHPLTLADLKTEQNYLQAAGFTLTFQ
ncbi:exopolyphosphatase / guanosine-5'-triphosphate,3'-diphosphate pyrophosphatase [Nitrosomonas sp. Nm51]|uniref:exopolyphosphatase n=1 Tax=Nitrosomonas sp. Nm51 TaxID=133720 RepID=UPI0008D124A0|nr:exopolyphosphatase [Nitrosomonas sp. Nm51]SER27568.1 exopolyphosphatase / guanosine-5'-triphosphate,3'-diphosphate pyrophosphatase [Nitrosomonas sp. Nm51]